MTISNVDFKAGTVIELSFATIIEGKENQLFGEYFPKVIPIVGDLGGQALGSYVVTRSSSQLDDPKLGAFFQWDNIAAFKKLHNEPRFLAIKHLRDSALKSFTNGLFYIVAQDTRVTFEEGESYALIAHLEECDSYMSSPLLDLTPAPDANKNTYSPVRIQVSKWNEYSDKILQKSKAEIFKFIFNTPR
jgi:hypothetical protein